MNLVEAAILGVVQGATEYLPVSSSGHLVLVPSVLGFKKAPFVFDILVQMGTLLGVILYFWKDLADVAKAMVQGLRDKTPFADPTARIGWWVCVSTVPAGVLGILLDDFFEEVFNSPRYSLYFLLLTAALLVVGEQFSKQERDERTLSLKEAVFIGFAQALALFPGVSRSGSTISAGMLMGLTREAAARYSFLMSIPVMVGAGVLALRKLLKDPEALSQHGLAILVGFLVSAVSGYICIRWFLGFLRRQSLMWFAVYCAVVSILGLLFLPTDSHAQAPTPTPAVASADTALPLDAVEKKAIQTLILAQASAWNHGDLKGFCAPYADDALFLSPSGLTRGRQAIFDRYQKKYGAAQHTMGSLTLQVLEMRGSSTFASVAMKWKLLWPEDASKAPASGLSLVTLHKVQGQWHIVQDASM